VSMITSMPFKFYGQHPNNLSQAQFTTARRSALKPEYTSDDLKNVSDDEIMGKTSVPVETADKYRDEAKWRNLL